MRIINKSDWETGPLKKALELGRITKRGLVVEFKSQTKNLKFVSAIAPVRDVPRHNHIVILMPRKVVFIKEAFSTSTQPYITGSNIVRLIIGYYTGGMITSWTELDKLHMVLKKYKPTTKPKSNTPEYKLWYASKQLKKAQRRHKLAETILKKWQKKVTRLEKRRK